MVYSFINTEKAFYFSSYLGVINLKCKEERLIDFSVFIKTVNLVLQAQSINHIKGHNPSLAGSEQAEAGTVLFPTLPV